MTHPDQSLDAQHRQLRLGEEIDEESAVVTARPETIERKTQMTVDEQISLHAHEFEQDYLVVNLETLTNTEFRKHGDRFATMLENAEQVRQARSEFRSAYYEPDSAKSLNCQFIDHWVDAKVIEKTAMVRYRPYHEQQVARRQTAGRERNALKKLVGLLEMVEANRDKIEQHLHEMTKRSASLGTD